MKHCRFGWAECSGTKAVLSQERERTWGHTQESPNAVILQAKEGTSSNTVPNVIGMGAKDAVYLLESKGLKVRISGIGKVKNQSIPGGNRVVKGQTIV